MKLIKVLSFYLIFAIALFININAYALEGMVSTDTVRVRNGAGTSHDILGVVNAPSIFKILDEKLVKTDDNTDSDCANWYKISYNDKTGFICSDYFLVINENHDTIDNSNFEKELDKFPASYRTYISELHKIYPNASFSILNTGLDFNTVLNNEDYIVNAGSKYSVRSLIQTSYDGYKSTNGLVYNWATNTWSTNISGGGSSWFAASRGVIAYYLDPRNFLTYNSSFMFLNHAYSKNIEYTEVAINGILSGSFMANSKTNDGVHTFAQTFIEAGKQSGISPYYLASRVIQEIGRSSSRSSYVDGKYNGYYNYYNIDAAGSSNLGNALARAKREGWDNDYKAIIGGAKFISNGYLSTGQSTLYLEKWDVVNGGNGYYSHQYMQNVQAIASEANILYNAYVKNGLLGTSMEFLIPVYDNMPSSTSLPNKGNPNNYLKDITINGYSINSFDMNKNVYEYNVSTVVNSIEVGALKVANTSTVDGIGTIKIDKDKLSHVISVKAGNGDVRKYTINFTRDDSKPISVSDIVSSGGFKNDGTYISGLTVGSDISDLVKKLKVNDNISVRALDSSK